MKLLSFYFDDSVNWNSIEKAYKKIQNSELTNLAIDVKKETV